VSPELTKTLCRIATLQPCNLFNFSTLSTLSTLSTPSTPFQTLFNPFSNHLLRQPEAHRHAGPAQAVDDPDAGFGFYHKFRLAAQFGVHTVPAFGNRRIREVCKGVEVTEDQLVDRFAVERRYVPAVLVAVAEDDFTKAVLRNEHVYAESGEVGIFALVPFAHGSQASGWVEVRNI